MQIYSTLLISHFVSLFEKKRIHINFISFEIDVLIIICLEIYKFFRSVKIKITHVFFTLVIQRKRWFRGNEEWPFFFIWRIKIYVNIFDKKQTFIFFDMVILNRVYTRRNLSLCVSWFKVTFCNFFLALIVWCMIICLTRWIKMIPLSISSREATARENKLQPL